MVVVKNLLFLLTFILELVYYRQLGRLVQSIKLPKFLLYLLAAAVLLIFEEHVNCGAYGCTRVLIPPTLPFLMTEVVLLGAIVKFFRPRKVLWPTVFYSLFGLAWEIFLGGLKGVTAVPVLITTIPWVIMNYAYVIIVPLHILIHTSKKNEQI